MSFGIGLANGPNDIQRIYYVGFGSFLALHYQLPDLIKLKALNSGFPYSSKYYVRLYGENILDQGCGSFKSLCSNAGMNVGGPIFDWILGNEHNNSIEGVVLSPAVTAERIKERIGWAREIMPKLRSHLPAFSPGIHNWQQYYAACKQYASFFDVIDVHCYGSYQEMLDIVDQVATIFPSKPLFISEWNFGAGNNVDIEQWARDNINQFISRLPSQVEANCYFMWQWYNPYYSGTPVDVVDTPLENFFAKYSTEVYDMGDINLIVPNVTKLTGNCEYNRKTTRGAFIHSTRGAASSIQADYVNTVKYFLTPSTPASAQFVVGPSEVTRMVHDDDIAWHAIENNYTHLGMEIVQLATLSDFTEFQYRAAAEIAREWAEKYQFPKVRVKSQFDRGFIGHEDSEQGKRYGKTDPGYKFDWDKFLDLVNDTPPPNPYYNPADPHHYAGHLVGSGFAEYLNDHQDIGLPRTDVQYDNFGNPYVWLSSSSKYPKGALLYWRNWIPMVKVISWD